MKHQAPNWLLIAGTGRNTGKTTLACLLLSQYRENAVTSVKITPHFHPLHEEDRVLVKNENFIIIREERISTKDSSRMLQAGASQALFVQAKDESLEEVFSYLSGLIPSGHPVICESGGMARIIEPGLFIMMHPEGEAVTWKSGPLAKPDMEASLDNVEAAVKKVSLNNGSWLLK